MQAYLAGIGSLELRQVEPEAPGEGEITVRVRASLSCGTDLKTLRRGHAVLPVPGPFGHEAAGDVLEAGPGVTGFQPGQSVMWVPTAPCGQCERCRLGLENQCVDLFNQIALGAHAQVIRLPRRVVAQHVFTKPGHLDYEVAALLEPLSCVVRGQRRLGPAGTMLIIGVGAIGLLHLITARQLGVEQIWVVGGRPRGVALAQRLGADRVFTGPWSELEPAILEAAGSRGIDAVVECTGSQEVWELAPRLVRPGGRVMLFGGLAGGTRVTFDAHRIHYHEVDLLGSFHYTPDDVRFAYDLLVNADPGRLEDFKSLITHRRPLGEIVSAFQEMLEGRFDGVKTAFYPWG